ncbi:MAG TPA: TolC family protein, partial [Longimicrobiales bacterium]|nr:TolC family protein [Longimicrobiales bacterium]
LTSEVVVFEPTWDLESLVRAAMATHPDMVAGRADAAAANAGVSMARSAYFPSLSLNAGWSGFTRRASNDGFLIGQAEDRMAGLRQQCRDTNELLSRLSPPMPPQDCNTLVVTEQMRSEILSENQRFPFDFETQPFSLSLGISLPVFQGFNRQQQLELARAQAEDVAWRVRGEELRIRADVEASLLNLEAAYRAVQLEERNRELAADQLRLAQERYRVGAASFLELMEAETVMARADRAYLVGVYTFQESMAALEAAVGQDLATPAIEDNR